MTSHFLPKLISSLTGILLTLFSHAQITGGTPPKVQWKQINTEHIRIIFPAGADSLAQRAANVISFMHNDSFAKAGNRKINIVLQNMGLQSNGYVGLGPFRSEFFTTSPQNVFDIGSGRWIDLLSVHEYRHVQQYNHMNTGLSHVAKVLFGDGGEALANSAAVPDWFFEGDAVFSETKWSNQGRGRVPAFFNGYKALWQQNKNYSYMKLRNGSLKDYTPNHYALGYMLISRGDDLYGRNFWNRVSHDAAAFKHLTYPFQHAFGKHSGTGFKQFRNETFEHFKKSLDVKKTPPQPSLPFENEEYPAFTNNGLLTVKSSYSEIPHFVLKTGSSEKKIRDVDYSLSNYFTCNAGKIVYSTYRPDIRWGNRAFNEIAVLDVSNGKQKRITKRTKYFSPHLNAAGTHIIAVHYNATNQTFLHLLDAQTGKLLKEYPNTENLVFSHPRFYANDIISEVRTTDGKMSIARININSEKIEFLLPFTYRTIGFPIIDADTLFFTGSYQSEDRLMAFSLNNRSLSVVQPTINTPVHAGNYALAMNDKSFAWHGFTATGNKVFTIPRGHFFYTDISLNDFINRPRTIGVESLLNAEKAEIPEKNYLVNRYSKITGLFKFHTLIPQISDPDYTLSLLSENILNTFHSAIHATYNRAEKFKRASISATYSGLFPFITGGAQYTIDRKTVNRNKPVYFNQFEPFAGISIPLNLSRGRSFTFLRAVSNFTFNNTTYTGWFKDSLPSFSYSYLNNTITFSHQVQKAVQNIYPRFAQTVLINYKAATSKVNGNQLLINSTLFFPGVFKNQSLSINGAFLKKDKLDEIRFSSSFPFSRGYSSINFFKMYKWGANYYFPVAYPDAGFANIAFLLRVRANVFYDFTRVYDFKNGGQKYQQNYNSTGVELTLDTKWWNQVPLSFGVRYSYLLNEGIFKEGPHKWEIIFPVNIFQR